MVKLVTEREVKDLPPNAKIKLKGGELIISKVRPTRGAIGVVPDDCQENAVCSSAFVVIRNSLPHEGSPTSLSAVNNWQDIA